MTRIAIVFSGRISYQFSGDSGTAQMVVDGAEEVIAGPHPLILVIENDIAKVLGNAINVLLKRQKKFICIDGIFANDGDYIDIGEPVAQGASFPLSQKL